MQGRNRIERNETKTPVSFQKQVWGLAFPISLQAMLQSSFGIADQLMIGKLGSDSIAAIGLAGKFASIYAVVLNAVAAAAGIMIAQYIGQKDEPEVGRSFFLNLMAAAAVAVWFGVMSLCMPEQIMGLYTKDQEVRHIAAGYLRIVAISYVPMAVSVLLSTLLRCRNAAVFPMYASIGAVLCNTLLNYLLIFGKGGLPVLGVTGAALATVVAQMVLCVLMLVCFWGYSRTKSSRLIFSLHLTARNRKQYLGILCPIFLCELFWSLGENVYTAIYGNMGTDACAAMTLTIPIQTLVMGALSGLGQAAGILIGKWLGKDEETQAYQASRRLMRYGMYGAVLFSVLLLVLGKFYTGWYPVSGQIRDTAFWILAAFGVIMPVKVQNMILGGGILRSGGKTGYIMWIDFIGTWLVGVPLGWIAAFVWKLPIFWVYFLLSLEECVRYGISMMLFRRKSWMKRLDGTEKKE